MRVRENSSTGEPDRGARACSRWFSLTDGRVPDRIRQGENGKGNLSVFSKKTTYIVETNRANKYRIYGVTSTE
ncbi:hypothetical protein DPEC_G00033400 [Dallia pectoralis]|uniref:Uncharacterized protein n=1 Tax=Dallia pectoralis TaxID=75939 RepID=A0ACC2HCY2_DALPE|nr:hypothetical protein DPEC_G00033400 [Dallia pectoralis]